MRIPARAVLIVVVTAAQLRAQKPPVVRQIGKLERISGDSLASAATALPMPGGRVLVNDITARRLLLFDSTLAHATVVADTTSATANAYGGRGVTLIRYRGDTALLIDPNSLSMYVVGPAGAIVRVMAIPRPEEAQALIGGIFGVPGFDARGRLVYFGGLSELPGILMLGLGMPVPNDERFIRFAKPTQHTDSTFVVRVELESRRFDSVASIRIPKARRRLRTDAQGLLQAIETTPDPLPVVDDWTVMPDGTIAFVRGQDYHVDWLDAGGHLTSSPKMPFDWQHVDDDRKNALIDSTVKVWQAQFDANTASRAKAAAGGGGGGGGGGAARGGGSGGRGEGSGSGGSPLPPAPTVAIRAALSDLPDYMPPITSNSTIADADGNLWIRTSIKVEGQPVYDIVNRRGELFDRVQLPAFRTVAGFGPGVVYMAMKDSAGVVHLERARVR